LRLKLTARPERSALRLLAARPRRSLSAIR
jgi:hypothetical protein